MPNHPILTNLLTKHGLPDMTTEDMHESDDPALRVIAVSVTALGQVETGLRRRIAHTLELLPLAVERLDEGARDHLVLIPVDDLTEIVTLKSQWVQLAQTLDDSIGMYTFAAKLGRWMNT